MLTCIQRLTKPHKNILRMLAFWTTRPDQRCLLQWPRPVCCLIQQALCKGISVLTAKGLIHIPSHVILQSQEKPISPPLVSGLPLALYWLTECGRSDQKSVPRLELKSLHMFLPILCSMCVTTINMSRLACWRR